MRLINPLALLRSEIDKRLDRFQTVTEALERYVLRVMDSKPEAAPAFVCVLVQAETERRPVRIPLYGPSPSVENPPTETTEPKIFPVSFGMSGYVRNRVTLQESVQIPLRNVRVVVFADLERVDIGGIFFGSDMAHAAPGSCPIAFIAELNPGHILRVPCSLRREK